MKKLIFMSIGLMLSIQSFGQIIQIDKGFYVSHYDTVLRGPIMVEYTISKILTPDSIKRKDVWKSEPGIRTPKLNDWKGSSFDRGHLAPAETFSANRKSSVSTFSLVNCSFQHYKFNRTTWSYLERAERETARTDSLKVYVGCLYFDMNRVTKTGIRVPTHFWRLIINHTDKTWIAFYFENVETRHDYNSYTVSLKQLQLLTEMDFGIPKNYTQLRDLK